MSLTEIDSVSSFRLLMNSRKLWRRAYSDRELGLTKPKPNQPVPFFKFQMLDLDSVTHHSSIGSQDIETIRLFGVTIEGVSTCVYLNGFFPHFFMSCTPFPNREKREDLKKALNTAFCKRDDKGGLVEPVIEIVPVYRKGYFGQVDQNLYILKVTVKVHWTIDGLVKILDDKAFQLDVGIQTFEILEDHELDFTTRFLLTCQAGGCEWISIAVEKLEVREPGGQRKTSCQIEMVTHWSCINWLRDVNTRAPLRVLSFDIECLPFEDKFPTAHNDPVITISNKIRTISVNGSFNDMFVTFMLDTCETIENCDVICFKSEIDMINAWSEFIRYVDPDIVVGYNHLAFDFDYITTRGYELGLQELGNFGRNLEQMSKDRDFRRYNLAGRLPYDLYLIVKRKFQLFSHRLEDVSMQFLGTGKVEFNIKEIATLFHSSAKGRSRIAKYCNRDAELPLEILSRLNLFENDVTLSNFYGIPMRLVINKGLKKCVILKMIQFIKSGRKTFKNEESVSLIMQSLFVPNSNTEKMKNVNYVVLAILVIYQIAKNYSSSHFQLRTNYVVTILDLYMTQISKAVESIVKETCPIKLKWYEMRKVCLIKESVKFLWLTGFANIVRSHSNIKLYETTSKIVIQMPEQVRNGILKKHFLIDDANMLVNSPIWGN